MPKVYNIRDKDIPKEAIFIGRPSKWRNPFFIGKDGTRKEVIDKFKNYLYTSGLCNKLEELRGKDLVCYCAPKPCHGDILIRLANAINK